MNIEFDATTHTYRADGIEVPSVTQILSSCGLHNFTAVSPDVLDRACQRGRIVHKCIEMIEAGCLDAETVDPALQGYVDAYLAAVRDGKIPAKPKHIEHRVYSCLYRYAGTIDAVANSGWLIDWKTRPPDPIDGLQLSGYWIALYNNIRREPRRLSTVSVYDDGRYEIQDWRYDPLTWLACVSVAKWKNKKG